MRDSRTARTKPASYSVDKEKEEVRINFTVPTSWKEMSQEQLRAVFDLMAVEDDPVRLKTLILLRLCHIKVDRRTRYGWRCLTEAGGRQRVVYLQAWEIQSFLDILEYTGQPETMDNRLDVVCGLHAADPLLQTGVTFGEYLNMEKYYQLFISTMDMEWLDNVAMWLYRDHNGRAAGYGDAVDDHGHKVEDVTLTPGERIGVMLWYGHVKRVMADAFPHFFRAAPEDDEGKPAPVNFIELYNVQLRALTGGDITKEDTVLGLECWRALTELDAKAREAEELERIRSKS